MGYVPPPERPLMKGESREHWYLERRAELLRAKSYNEGMLRRWIPVIVVLILILCFVCFVEIILR